MSQLYRMSLAFVFITCYPQSSTRVLWSHPETNGGFPSSVVLHNLLAMVIAILQHHLEFFKCILVRESSFDRCFLRPFCSVLGCTSRPVMHLALEAAKALDDACMVSGLRLILLVTKNSFSIAIKASEVDEDAWKATLNVQYKPARLITLYALSGSARLSLSLTSHRGRSHDLTLWLSLCSSLVHTSHHEYTMTQISVHASFNH
ncbi:hypothetical protein RJT34_13599 [Clitoria ternatea]|uniref:Uncharacterized protein n=1 Tax=Clitoria ternatea TaxID=43366 RepID=A0AAN9PLW8_CLITE